MNLELGVFQTVELGALIAALDGRRRHSQEVWFNFGYFRPTHVASYRGYYDHLALGFTGLGERATPVRDVAALLAELRGAIGKRFEGYEMRPDTPVWAANYGESPGTSIIGIADCDYRTVLLTGYVARMLQLPKPRPWYVYVVRCSLTGRVKIGRTQQPKARLLALHSSTPGPLAELAILPAPAAAEAELHARFAQCRVHREWFVPDAAMSAWLREIAT